MNIIYLLNSDFGKSHTVGVRALPIAKVLITSNNNNLNIFCRDYLKECEKNYNLTKIIPFGFLGVFFMKILTAIPIYISKKLQTNSLRNMIFEYFLIKKLDKINLNEIDLIHSWDFLPKTYEYIKLKNPNIIICQDLPIALSSILIDLSNKESFFEESELEIQKYIINSFKFINIYIVPSEFVKRSLLNEGIKKGKIIINLFGVDIKKFKPLKNRDNSNFNVAFSGNVNNRKGIPYLIQAWKELNLQNANLNIYGRVYPEIKSLLIDLKKYNIKIHGFVDLKSELPKNHLFVFPSLMEGSAKAIYEAMACKIPIITTLNAGSVIKDGSEGFIIPIQDVGAIKEKINYFYNNRSELIIFGKRARRLATNYTWDKYSKNINKIYKHVLEFNKYGK